MIRAPNIAQNNELHTFYILSIIWLTQELNARHFDVESLLWNGIGKLNAYFSIKNEY